MSDINALMDRLNGLPGRGTEAESHLAARNLAAAGRKLGADGSEIREVLDMCGLIDGDNGGHVDLIKPIFNPSTRVSVHIQSRRKG